MAERRKQLSVETKQTILTLSEDGFSGRKIAEILKINPSTVHKFLKWYGQRGYLENESRSGRPTKYNDRVDRQILRVVKTNRRKTLKEITNTYNESTPVELSESTVKRRLAF